MKKILMVEDDESICDAVATVLKHAKMKSIFATDGEEALKIVYSTKPDGVILDLNLRGGIDGFEICRRIKSDSLTKHIVVIIATGSDSPEDKETGISAGADDYIVKPYRAGQLRDALIAKFTAREACSRGKG